MYLPQYHPIPENDKTWGKGFTEWTNVASAKPLFHGHYQPRIPADLGFYDLRLPIIREQQAEMARNAGVEGFMYWHYWFSNGKTLLEKPFEEVLHSGKPDFPFCLGWANHSWTVNAWRGANGLNQSFNIRYIAKIEYPGEEDIINHFKYCLPAFLDKRYITVDGKPFFYIYAPDKHPNIAEFISLWNKLAQQNGLKGIHFVANVPEKTETWHRYIEMGFDAVNINNLTNAKTKAAGSKYIRKLKTLLSWYIPGLLLNKYDYGAIVNNMQNALYRQEYCYPTILPGFDRTPRVGRAAVILHNATPEKFGKLVHDTISTIATKKDEHKIIILKSWNEWGEGNYMEPDIRYGDGFLKALRNQVL